MTTVFADTYYFIALFSPADDAHRRAVDYTRQFTGKMLTTDWIITELADGFANVSARIRFLQFYDRLRLRPEVTIVPCSRDSLEQGMDLFRSRPDKDWSLTDCISFRVMEDYGLQAALTGDRHFEQAGFTALLR